MARAVWQVEESNAKDEIYRWDTEGHAGGWGDKGGCSEQCEIVMNVLQ